MGCLYYVRERSHSCTTLQLQNCMAYCFYHNQAGVTHLTTSSLPHLHPSHHSSIILTLSALFIIPRPLKYCNGHHTGALKDLNVFSFADRKIVACPCGSQALNIQRKWWSPAATYRQSQKCLRVQSENSVGFFQCR